LMECEATRLFAERASSAHGAFQVTQENCAAIAQIARRLDGIPLAIELAAARARMLSPEQIASRLDDRFRLLTGGSRTAMPRQRTLQAAIDWSYHSLEDEEARLFDKLSVFRGGFTLEAVECVGVGEGDDPLYIMDTLFQLVDKSLVAVSHADSNGDARYRLLETLRQYAGERLAESGQADETRRRHAEYYLEMIHGVQSDLWDSGSKEAVGLLVTNHDNLRGALDWALDAGETEIALRLVGDLGYLWMIHRYVNEGNEKATRAFALAEEQGNAPADAMAPALFTAELVAIQLPDFERGMAYIEESIRLYRQVQDDRGLARSTYARGVMPWALGDIDQASGMLEEAMSLDNLNADPWSQGWCRSLLGSIAASRGQYEGVLDTFQQTINALQSRGDHWGTAFAKLMAGSVAKDLGNYSVATAHIEEGLPQARDSGDRSCVGALMSCLATIAWLQNDHERALELQQQGIAEYKEAGGMASISWAVACLRAGMRTPGDVWWVLGLYAEAREMPEEIGAKTVIAEGLYSVGRIANIRGDQVRASDILRQCLTLHQEIEYVRGVELALLEMASVASAKNDPQRAARLLGAAENAAKTTAPEPSDYERMEFERVTNQVQSGLNDEDFNRLQADGQAMPIEIAVAHALSDAV
ncbi:MAG: hypothetical protein IIC24_01945, partial [Chloroflexi bacterium]|nr:hypothetical protein [Chloroflexota bacterium]